MLAGAGLLGHLASANLWAQGVAGAMAPPAASPAPLWVVLSERNAAQEEALRVLRGGTALPLQAGLWSDWAQWEQLGSGAALMLLGARALAAWGQRQPPLLPAAPWVAGLLSQSAWAGLPAAVRNQAHAAWLDQPLPRLAELLRLALPDRSRVGVLFGPATRAWREPLHEALQQRQWQMQAAQLHESDGPAELFAALSRVLDGSEALLLLPDAQVVQPSQFQNLLIAAYRQRLPVVSFSQAHVRAGATLGLFTTPAQAAQQMLDLLRHAQQPRARLRQQWAAQFELAINEPVARSLNLQLPSVAMLAGALMQRSGSAHEEGSR
jgi:hypothetical protein